MKTCSILVVDDDSSIRKALNRTLKTDGYEVQLATGASEALEMLRKAAFDLVLSDHLMPEMTGLEMLKLVRDRRPDVGRVMLTGHADVQVALNAINHGEIHRFLTKPWDDTELKVTLYSVFREVEEGRRNRQLMAMARGQASILLKLRQAAPEKFRAIAGADQMAILAHELLEPIAA
ncbi:MAG: response regulator [Myxococcales bacterium]